MKYCLIALIIFGMLPTYAQQESLILDNNAEATLYYPKSYSQNKQYTVLMALHGIYQTPEHACNAWKLVADQEDLILICPKGSSFSEAYTRSPIDDRKHFSAFIKALSTKINIAPKGHLLAGFSRGGNYALETATLSPPEFQHYICLFGFLSPQAQTYLTTSKEAYSSQTITIITGNYDQTYTSSKKAYTLFSEKNRQTKLISLKNVIHSYPNELKELFSQIKTWQNLVGNENKL